VNKGLVARVALALALSSAGADAKPTAPTGRPARAATADAGYLDELVARARSLELSRDEMWNRLLHYRTGLFGGRSSEADGKHFFLAEEGKGDPSAELEATLRGLFGPEPQDAGVEHPYCRFPARLAWLHSKLGFDFTRLPRRSCPKFQEFVEQTRARSLTLVFSSYYLNNPASAFGHTFLRINKSTRRADDTDLELLDYGIDYSATVDTNNSLVYALKGLMGLFPGRFRRVPYYLKVREYNDHESRDIWEYELALSKQEVAMVQAHLWELGPNHFDYYYLSENCSYHILGVLEVANPRLRLLERVGWPVIPADTVKAVVAEPGLVRRVRYRPSNRTQYRHRVSSLNDDEVGALSALARDPNAPLSEALPLASRARVLDAALDLVDFRFAGQLARAPGTPEDPESVRFKQRLLERRAALDAESEDVDASPPFREQPHIGHDSRRLGLGSGFQAGRGWFHGLDLRLALHDLADPGMGYPATVGIEFLPMRFRYWVEEPRLTLEDFSLVRIHSLTPLDRFESSLSWKVDVGATRLRDAGCDDCAAGFATVGGGLAVPFFTRKLLFFALGEARVAAPVQSGLFDVVRAGLGPAGGVRLELTDGLRVLGTGFWNYLPKQEPNQTWQIDGAVRAEYSSGFALGIEGTRQPSSWSARGVSYVYF